MVRVWGGSTALQLARERRQRGGIITRAFRVVDEEADFGAHRVGQLRGIGKGAGEDGMEGVEEGKQPSSVRISGEFLEKGCGVGGIAQGLIMETKTYLCCLLYWHGKEKR